MLKLQNKIPSALTIGGKIVERIKMRNEVVWEKVVEPDYLYIENTYNGSNTITFETTTSPTLPSSEKYSNQVEYSTDKINWTTLTFNSSTPQTITINTGEKLYLRNDTGVFNYYNDIYNTYNTNIKVSQSNIIGGNINTLLDYNNPDTVPISHSCFYNLFRDNISTTDVSGLKFGNKTLKKRCYGSMFENCTSLTSAPKSLPATTLATYCYSSMFSGCKSLTSVPELPATTLEDYCYSSMFSGCTSLTTAPTLPATTLASDCYYYMFQKCTSLTTAPELPATTLAHECYSSMFKGCKSLTTAPTLPATTLARFCYQFMFENCTSLTTAPELPATTLVGYCYDGMFEGCTSLVNAPVLPATTLLDFCYDSMFEGCTSLVNAPALPATTLAIYCYRSMFQNCTSLTTAPELPATTLAENCYDIMFWGCKSLTTAPIELPATTLANFCYRSMFENCTSLTTAPILPATTLASYCYDSMFKGCTSLTTAPTLPAKTLVGDCYESMFQGCTSLTSVTIYAETTAGKAFYEWLRDVSSSGTVYNNGLLDLPKNNASGVPIGWSEVVPEIQSITANPDTFTIKSYNKRVKCTSTLTITTTLGTTVTDTNSAIITVSENTGDTTRTLTEMIPYKSSSYQITIVQTANDVKPPTSWNVVSTGTYPFELNTNGYYESTNKGHDNSYSYATLNYEGFDELVLECINFAESNYDYGIISQPDVQLSESTSDDGATGSTNVFHNFNGEQSANPVQIVIPSDGGSHFITIKFIKDSSGNEGNDSLQFKVIEP